MGKNVIVDIPRSAFRFKIDLLASVIAISGLDIYLHFHKTKFPPNIICVILERHKYANRIHFSFNTNLNPVPINFATGFFIFKFIMFTYSFQYLWLYLI